MKKLKIEAIYYTALYLRLSDDDGDVRESNSISNQRILLQGYMKGKPEFVIVKECVDDGYTGTNFDRPGFQELMRLAKEGKINCIIVKDLSRFGRDFSGVLQYVERILPQMGVRLILVNDGYDSISPNHDFITLRLKSFINDIYPADTSRNIRENLHAKMAVGQCVAPFVPYGFLKSPEDKHKLILDPVAVSVVQDIFHLKLRGHSMKEIAEILNDRAIPTPYAYKTCHQQQKFKTSFCKGGNGKWEATMIRRILTDEKFTGTLVQGKTTTPNYKVKKIIYKDKEEWVRCENAIEMAVDRHTFDVVQNLLEKDARRSAEGAAFLSGLVECADCGQSMIRKSPDKKHYYYVCSSYLYEKACSSHSFSEKKLSDAVKKTIRYYISLLADMDEVLQYVQQSSLPEKKLYEADLQLDMLKQEMQRLLKIKKNLYESFCDNILDEEEFRTYKAKYDRQLEEIESAVQKQQAEIANMAETLEKQRQWIRYFLQYQDKEEIDHMMLVMLVKRIRIHEGKRVSIDFWFADEFEKTISFLRTVNHVQPNETLECFLLKGGVEYAQSK